MIIVLACITTAALVACACAVAYAHTARADTRAARAEHARDQARHAATIDMLCQRIQAPQAAVEQHTFTHGSQDMPQPPPFNDDDAMLEAMRENRERHATGEL